MRKNVKLINKKLNTTKLTKNQKQILFYLYQFRFLHTNQIQKLFNHKNPHRSQEWLKDLKEKGYIARQHYKDPFDDKTKPAVYFLTIKTRQLLKTDEKYDIEVLDKLYKESKRTPNFRNYCLTLANVYLYFLSHRKNTEEIRFFTENQLLHYDYFPNPLPSAYIAVKSKGKTKRYLLELFKDYATAGVLHSRLRAYIDYIDSEKWEANAEGEEFPIVLFICPSENLKKHIYYVAKALFEKEYEEKFSLFLTSATKILNNAPDLWKKVEIES